MADEQEWGEVITLTGAPSVEDIILKNAIRETHERIALEMLGGAPYQRARRNWWDQVTLAWECLLGRITWDDIG